MGPLLVSTGVATGAARSAPAPAVNGLGIRQTQGLTPRGRPRAS